MLVKRALIWVSGRRIVQKWLARNVKISLYLMGVGSGSDVAFSGEGALFDALKERRKPPFCIFDVGSNKGQFLRIALEHIGIANLSMHCFEPGANTFATLVDCVKKMPKSEKITLNNVAVGKEPGEATLHFDFVGSGLASLTRRKLEHHGIDFDQSETVRITTIDDYCLENSIDRIDLLKIDIEGHEFDSLLGAKRMLDARSIGMVSFEFGGTNIDTRVFFRDFWYLFENAGMRIYRITPSKYLSPIDFYTEIHEQFGGTNFVAIADR